MLDPKLAHRHSSNHRTELIASAACGCFYCLNVFSPSEVKEWIDWPPGTPEEKHLEEGTTALCPHCGIDSVIGDASGYQVDHAFLSAMQAVWFNVTFPAGVKRP